MPSAYDRLATNNHGLVVLGNDISGEGDGFKKIAKMRANKKKEKTLNEQITTLDKNMADLGVSPEKRAALMTGVRMGGADNAMTAIKAAFETLSRPAKDQLIELENKFIADRANGTLTKEKIASYQDQANTIIKANEIFSGALSDQDAARDLAKKKGESDIRVNEFILKQKLGLETSKKRYEQWGEAVKKGRITAEEFATANMPDMTDKKVFPDGMNEAVVLQAIMKMNPKLSLSDRNDLLYIYKNRDTMDKSFLGSVMDAFRKKKVAEEQNDMKDNSAPPPPNPNDVESELNKLSNEE